MLRLLLVAVLCVLSYVQEACAGDATIAVATNFREVAETVRERFAADLGYRIVLTAGSTGKLYAQVKSGAPYDALLAADRKRPRLLERSGAAVAGTRFVYAKGRLALWSADPDRIVGNGRDVLLGGDFKRLALANPELAPYGAASRQVLRHLGLWRAKRSRIVLGENAGQAFALVATRNADLGLVALAAIVSPRNRYGGSYWLVPEDLHDPILQEAVLLQHGADNAAAIAFLAYLKTDIARSIIRTYGYRD